MKKRISLFFAALMAATTLAVAEENVEFAYDAYAELTSTFIWRGQYNGGLSFQPDLAVGFDSEHTSFRFGTWWSVGASDWGFRKGLEKEEGYNPNTHFVGETDIYLNANIWGVTLGGTKYHFYEGANFWRDGLWEVNVGYDFSTLTGIGLKASYNVIVGGNDDKWFEDEEDENGKQDYSGYLEIGYEHEWEDYGITLGGAIGMATNGHYYNYDGKFTVCNIQLRLDKTWEVSDYCTIGIFGIGSINPDGIHKDKSTAFIKASGDDKICCQNLNGAIGLSLSF